MPPKASDVLRTGLVFMQVMPYSHLSLCRSTVPEKRMQRKIKGNYKEKRASRFCGLPLRVQKMVCFLSFTAGETCQGVEHLGGGGGVVAKCASSDRYFSGIRDLAEVRF